MGSPKPLIRNQVKHLLIILISFLLLSSPLFGDNHKGETLYRWGFDLDSGEFYKENIWKRFGDKETEPVYKGDVKNGKPNGFGVMTFPWGDKYIGEWKEGKYHGQGTETYTDGGDSMYVGEWKNGEYHGQGTYTFGKGKFERNMVVGKFKDGEIWNGTTYDKDGNIKVKFVNGKRIIQ